MNFFGHAMIATWQSTEPAFVLGAMLPDFATMIGARVPRVDHDGVASGVRFHHDTDRVFHDAPTFRALQAEARRSLRERGLRRSSALAVGHIGVEILLDSVLAADPRGRAAYVDALHQGRGAALGRHVVWAHAANADQYEQLVTVLHDRGVPAGAGDAGMVAWRIARALSSRPRLRLDAEGERIVRQWAFDTAPLVARGAPPLIGEVTVGLEQAGARLDARPLFPVASV